MARGGRWIQPAIGRGAGCERIKRRGAGARSALSCGRRSAERGGRGAAPGGRAGERESAGGGGGSARAEQQQQQHRRWKRSRRRRTGLSARLAALPAGDVHTRSCTRAFFIFLFFYGDFFNYYYFFAFLLFLFLFFFSSLSRGVFLVARYLATAKSNLHKLLAAEPAATTGPGAGIFGASGARHLPLPRGRAGWPCPALRDLGLQECRSPETPRAGGTHL